MDIFQVLRKPKREEHTDEKQNAFAEAYHPCHDAFIRYCTALGYGKMDTEDLVQDVLLSAYQQFDRIRQKDQFLHYLIRAARNRAVSRLRRRKYQASSLDKHVERLRAKGVSAEQLVDIDIIYRALDRLPIKQKEAILLFEVSGFSMQEIAEIQKSSLGAIKTKISRGRQRIRQILTDQPSSSNLGFIWATAKLLVL